MIYETNDSGFEYAIPKVVGRYCVDSRIASGSFSVVMKVHKIQSNEIFAMKVISRKHMIENSSIFQLEQELRILETTNHPNIIKLEEIIYKPDYIYVVMEYCRTDLLNELMKRGAFLQYEVKKYFYQICCAVNYLHSHGISHHDLKPENVLITDQDDVKLSDFGSAIMKGSPQKYIGGTLCYASPESILREIDPNYFNIKEYLKSDIWTLGIILYVLTTSSFPFPCNLKDDEMALHILKLDYSIPLYIDNDTKEIIRKCLQACPEDRPSMDALMQLLETLNFMPPSRAKTGSKGKISKKIVNFVSTSAIITKPSKECLLKSRNNCRIRVSNSANINH